MIALVFLKAHSGYWAENGLYREAIPQSWEDPGRKVAVGAVRSSRILETIFKSRSDFLTH